MRNLSSGEVKLLAEKFRTDFGFNSTEPINAKTLLRITKTIILYKPLSEDSYGISIKTSKANFMLINSNNSRGRQHFTIAHEFYHLFFDPNPTPHMCNGVVTGEEKNANRFATELLMPEKGIIKEIPSGELQNITIPTIIRLEQLFGVSRQSLLYRLHELKIINKTRLNELLELKAKETARLYGYDTALYEKGNEGTYLGDYGEKARTLFERGIISEGHYIELIAAWEDGKE